MTPWLVVDCFLSRCFDPFSSLLSSRFFGKYIHNSEQSCFTYSDTSALCVKHLYLRDEERRKGKCFYVSGGWAGRSGRVVGVVLNSDQSYFTCM